MNELSTSIKETHIAPLKLSSLKQRFTRLIPNVDFCSLRYTEEKREQIAVQRNVIQPPYYSHNAGAMVTVIHNGGLGYAATSDLTDSGLNEAIHWARRWAERTQEHSVIDFSKITMPHPQGEYIAVVERPWHSLSLAEKLDLIYRESLQSRLDKQVTDWGAYLESIQSESLYVTCEGGEVYQQQQYLMPYLFVTVSNRHDTQRRSLGGWGWQGGLEILDHIHFAGKGWQLAQEALQLLAAPNCPSGQMDVVLAPDQMVLQIHESIGHPLELDRILGDERNYAGTSFVTPDMFGHYQYGSQLLNVIFDPTAATGLASYSFDDEGLKAEKVYLIQSGILKTPLGSKVSQTRSGLPGVANSRASHWNRPPIDRMANLFLEPGTSSFYDMISTVERGVFMQTNASWSIDDSRNKFQFGCEWGQLIENGCLTKVVKNPNYRGISATFWRNLQQVGNRDTYQIMGTPNCGKGEPNQIIRTGHASPTCRFSNVEVFGGL